MRPRVATVVVPCSLLFSFAAWRLDPQVSFGVLSRVSVSDGLFWSLGTYSFIHLDWIHYLINMLGLVAVSVIHRSIGDGLGARHEWGAYCAGVLGGGLAHVATEPFLGVVGASAGVLGLLAAVVLTRDGGRHGTFGIYTLRIGVAILAIGSIMPGIVSDGVSIASHSGGVAAGVAYGAYWRRARTPACLKI